MLREHHTLKLDWCAGKKTSHTKTFQHGIDDSVCMVDVADDELDVAKTSHKEVDFVCDDAWLSYDARLFSVVTGPVPVSNVSVLSTVSAAYEMMPVATVNIQFGLSSKVT